MRSWRESFPAAPGPGEALPGRLPVSVIIPCFNAGSTLGRALGSVAGQSRPPAEVIIVDDGSDDPQTRRVLRELGKAYDNDWLKIFYLPVNRGPAAARNYAWERASREWLAFLDADDSWSPVKLEVQFSFLRRHPEFDLCGHLLADNRPEGLSAPRPQTFAVREYSLNDLLWGNPFRTPGVLLRRHLNRRFPAEQRYSEDFRLWLELLAAGRRAALLEIELAATHKPAFGERGLSRRLWAMEKGELAALGAVRPAVGPGIWAAAAAWSGLKFVRRRLLTAARRAGGGRLRGRPGTGKPPVIIFLVTDDWFFLLHRRALAQAARTAGFRVLVATGPGVRGAEITACGFGHRVLPLRRESRNPFSEVRAVAAIFKLYREVRPAIVHQVAIKPILYGTVAARLAGVGAVVNAVTGLGHIFIAAGRSRYLLRKMVEQAYRRIGNRERIVFLFENPDDREHFLNRRLLPAGRAVLILGSGVDTGRFRPPAAPLPAAARRPVVLLAARLLWSKGVGEYVKAARKLRRQGIEAEFQLAGVPDPANPRAVPAACLLSWHREGVVRWLGYCDDMPALYRRADIFCLPTLYREGIPVALLEAAACGKPLVGTDMPGCREIVIPGRNGFLVTPGSVDELARALESLLADAALRRRFGAAGRRLVKARFGQEKVIAETFAVYRDLLEEGWPKKD